MNVGDIILVHTKGSALPSIVQHFQEKRDPESGRWNHSMRYWGKVNGTPVVLEAAQKDWGENQGKLRNAMVCFNPLSIYTDHPDKYELLVLSPKARMDWDKLKEIMIKWEGTPYDFKNLIGDQPWWYIFKKWRGAKKSKAHKQMVCHEVTMRVGFDYNGEFPNWHKAQVYDIYHSPKYKHSAFSRV